MQDGNDKGSSLNSPDSFDELSPASQSQTNLEPARSRIYSEEDEEIRIAKAMALAIQNNPNMTPDEIHQLTSELQKQSEVVAKQNMTLTMLAPPSANTPKEEEGDKNLLIPGRVATVLKDKEKIPTMAEAAATIALPSKLELEKQKKRMTAKQLKEKAKGKFKDMVAGANIKTASSFEEGGRDASEKSPKRDRNSPNKAAPKTPPRVPFGARNISNPQPPPALDKLDVPPLQHEPTTTPVGSVSSDAKKRVSPGSDSHSLENVRLSAVLWKRRSGFGKLSSKNAWERRRVVLAGTSLSYFKKIEDGVEVSSELAPTPKDSEVVHQSSVVSDSAVPSKTLASIETGNAQRRATWLEQAAMNIEKAKANLTEIGIISGSDMERNPPRGSLDLVKERAIVAATTGHSGAPSPFCISIKVRDETKWKFSFDSHTQQMEWLAALTDVVVSSSVDNYNAALVLAADPNHENAGMFVAAPLEPEHDAAEGHRLWMLQKYKIQGDSSSTKDESSSSDDDDGVQLEDEVGSRELYIEEPSVELSTGGVDTLALRDKNLQMMTVLMNVALFYSHASSTGISNFWYLVTFVNLALWSLITKDAKNKTMGTNSSQPGGTVQSTDAEIANDLAKGNARGTEQKKNIQPSFKPDAGTTTMRLENSKDVASNEEGHIFAGWRVVPGSNFMVRSHGYLSTKEKVPSPGELYKLARCDIFESPRQYRDMAPRVKLPELDFDDEGIEKTWHAPSRFVISVALPTDPPKMRGSADDGGGYTITMYYTMKKETRDILRRVTSPDYDPSQEKIDDAQKSKVNAVKLFNSWCRRAPTDPKFQARFKLMATCQNLKEIGIPSWIGKYNGKPVLIKRAGTTGFLYSHPELSAMEFDVTFHPFPYLAKQAICYLKENFFKKVLVTFGFCIEGRSDDELPECLIGLMQLCYPDPQYGIQAADFFSGKSPKSF